MSNFKFLSLEERLALPAEDFGDPERRLFPILSQEDLEQALASLLPDMEAVKSRIIAIATRKGLALPEGVGMSAFSEDSVTEGGDAAIAEFALEQSTATSDNQYVLRTGKIFQAGSYPDKRFEMTPEELCKAIKSFAPVDIDLEHMNTVLDGKLGRLEAVALGSDGWSIIGTVRLPKWLDDQLGDGERKVSATWDRETKTLKKLALVRNPRIKDAALMAAFTADELIKAMGATADFSATNVLIEKLTALFEMSGKVNTDKTYEGMYVLQTIHDIASRAGAVCSPDNSAYSEGEEPEFVSVRESRILQQMHDAAVLGGAKCKFKMEGEGYTSDEEDDDDEEYSASHSDKNDKEITTMNLKDIIAFFKNLPEDANLSEELEKAIEAEVAENAPAAEAPAEEAVPVVEAEEVVENSGPSEREIELEKQVEALVQQGIARDAEQFAASVIEGGYALPAERETIVSLFSQAANDDRSNEAKVAFNTDGKSVTGSRTDALRALFSVKKPHVLTEEQIESETLGILVNNSDSEADYAEEAAKQAKEFAMRRNKKNNS